METFIIKNHSLEYIDEIHSYLVDGIVVPSVTQLLNNKFKNKYENVNPYILQRAAEHGTAIHKAVQDYCEQGIETECEELQNFKFLQKTFKFQPIKNEVPIIIFYQDQPVAAGRLDLVIKIQETLQIADIKTTSTLDKEYLKYQLNLYRIGYQQCYGEKIEGLKGIHLRKEKRKLVDIPINEECLTELLGGKDE